MAAHSDRNGASSESDLDRVSRDVSGRLAARGIALDGNESPDDLLQMSNAVEAFERVVQARGGDLMVDEGPHGRTTEPDDPQFALPVRNAREAVAAYLERLGRATDDARRQSPRP